MSFENSFRDELGFLREQGRNYSDLRPHLSRYLCGKNADPDVERLLEGFAFLTSRLRDKINDDFPELTHSIIALLWPNFLRPFPSVTIVQIKPLPGTLTGKQTVDAGIDVNSKAIRGVSCRFVTSRKVDIYPIERIGIDASHSREASVLTIKFQVDNDKTLDKFSLDELTFFLGTQSYESQSLYLWLNYYLDKIEIVVDNERFVLPKNSMSPIGLSSGEGILPYPKNVYEGYRLIHEYFAYPDGFNFVSVKNMAPILSRHTGKGQFNIVFKFKRPLPADIRINEQHMRIFCTPAVNLFEHYAEPINLTGLKTEYKLVPVDDSLGCYEIFSVDGVFGWEKGQVGRQRGQGRQYRAFESFEHEIERAKSRTALYYRLRVRNNINEDGFNYFLSFVRSDEVAQIGFAETISIDLTCSNRDLPLELGVGEIEQLSGGYKEAFTVSNVSLPSAPLRPVIDNSLFWLLISNLSLNYLSLLSKDSLKTILRAYDFRAQVDRQAERVSKLRLEEGIVAIKTSPIDRIFKGMTVRGLRSELILNEESFANEGDLYIFATILSRFFSLYASINSFHELIVINQKSNERYTFGMQLGSQPII